MTKKINSLLFRLGINSLWSIKMSNFTNIFNTLRLEQAIQSELIKYKWNILSIKWNKLEANVQIYNSFTFSKKRKQKIFWYFKKMKNVKKLSEKFNVNSNFVNNFLKKIKILGTKQKTVNFLINNNNFLNLFYKFRQLQTKLKYLTYLNSFNWTTINLLLFNITQLKKKKINFKSNWKLKNKKLSFQLRKINGFLYFKVLSISIENVLYFFAKKIIKINVSNIWKNQGWIFKFIFKDKFILKLLFLSCIYNNTKMFSEFIALQLKKNKNHKKVLRKITLIIEIFWKHRSANLKGIQLRVTGKLNGSMRKSKYHYSIGKVQLQTFKIFLNYNISISYTKFGIISTKFWILHGNK